MTKKILALGLSLFLITSLNVFGAKMPKIVHKMPQRIEVLDDTCYAKEAIPDYPSYYRQVIEPKVFYPLSNDTVGYTYYDYQFNDIQHRQIAIDPSGTLHFTWMDLVTPDYYYGDRYMDFNARYSDGTWLPSGGMHVTTADTRAGYGGIDILPDNREVLFYHRTQPYPFMWGVTISIEDNTPGSGYFNSFDIPDSIVLSSEKGYYPALACAKLPIGDTVYIHITHAQEAGCGNKYLGYVRCFEKPSSKDTLVCDSPGWTSPLLTPKDTKLNPNRAPYSFSENRLGGTVVATSPVSQKVCVVWLKNMASSQTMNELRYFESTNNGNDWMEAGSMGTPVQLTNYGASGYIDRAYDDIAAVYDYNDELHIIWTTNTASDWNDVTLWHWSSATGIRKVSSAFASPYSIPHVDPGAWNLLIAKFTLGVGSDPSDSAYNYLYVNYTKFKEGDISAGGFANGDICVKASSNGGLTWGPEINLTNTNSDGCLPGNCESEHWSSMAEGVDSFLYIQYIYDLDAGGVPQSEGTYTLNPVRYLKYPRFLVPAMALMTFTPPMMVDWAANNGTTSDSLVVSNENGTAALYVKLSGPSWLNISPANFYIAEGAPPQAVNLTFNGAGYSDTLLVDSLLIATNDSLLGGAELYTDTDWVKIHFVVADTFYYAEYDTVNTGTGGIIATVSNVGNLGNGEDNCGMYYKGNDYLSEFTPVILVDIPGYGWSASTWMGDSHDFLPESHLKVTEYPSLHATVVSQAFAPINPRLAPPYHWYWSWWTVVDQSIFFWKPSEPNISSTEYEKIILKYTKLIENPPPSWWCYITEEPLTLPSIYLGFAADWDVPACFYNENVGGYDDTLNLIWLTTTNVSSIKGGFLFLYVEKDGDTTFTPLGAHILANSTQLYPLNRYDDDSLYKYMSTPGWSIESDSAQDMNILVSAAYLENPAPPTEVTMKYALMVTDQGYEDLIELADGLKGARCADANEDGNVSVSDVIMIVNYLFKGGPEPWLYYCDINGDCGVTVSDIVYLINYLFKGGLSPKCDCAECDP